MSAMAHLHRVALISLAMCCGTLWAQSVSIPSGSFLMGSSSGDDDEQPVSSVQISAFRLDRFETTVAQYDSCVAAGACSPAHYDDGKCIMWTEQGLRFVTVPRHYRSPDYPVVCVSWMQAREYCRFRGKRLPTEAEWEYAARAGSTTTFPWGEDDPGARTCVAGTDPHPRPCGTTTPNTWGLADMIGNVWEWVDDRYQTDFYRERSVQNPRGPEVGRYRVVRGGGWYSTSRQLRVANRQWFVPESGEVSIGIRCAQ